MDEYSIRTVIFFAYSFQARVIRKVCTYSYSIILSTTGDHMVFGELYDAIGSWLWWRAPVAGLSSRGYSRQRVWSIYAGRWRDSSSGTHIELFAFRLLHVPGMYSYQYFPSFDLATTTCDYYSGINSPIILVLVIYTRASNSPSIQVLVLGNSPTS